MSPFTSILVIAPRPFVLSPTPVQAWRAARDEAGRAYRAWAEAPPEHKRDAYAAYSAAADQEAAACEMMRRRCRPA